MKKRFGILCGFLVLALMDSVLSYAMPVDFTYQKLSVVWHFYLIGLLVFTRDKPWLTRVLMGMLGGLVSDLFFTDSFPVCFFLYPLLTWLAGIWKHRMAGNQFAFAWYMVCLFLADWIPWLWQRQQGLTNVSLIGWGYHVEMITLLCGGLSIILVIYIDMVMDRFFLLQKHMQRKAEKKKRLSAAAHMIPNANHPGRQR